MSTASRGRALEHEIRELFREKGWSVVRGAGSKGEFADWKCDLVASRVTAENDRKVYLAVVLAQCKLKGRKRPKVLKSNDRLLTAERRKGETVSAKVPRRQEIWAVGRTPTVCRNNHLQKDRSSQQQSDAQSLRWRG